MRRRAGNRQPGHHSEELLERARHTYTEQANYLERYPMLPIETYRPLYEALRTVVAQFQTTAFEGSGRVKPSDTEAQLFARKALLVLVPAEKRMMKMLQVGATGKANRFADAGEDLIQKLLRSAWSYTGFESKLGVHSSIRQLPITAEMVHCLAEPDANRQVFVNSLLGQLNREKLELVLGALGRVTGNTFDEIQDSLSLLVDEDRRALQKERNAIIAKVKDCLTPREFAILAL